MSDLSPVAVLLLLFGAACLVATLVLNGLDALSNLAWDMWGYGP